MRQRLPFLVPGILYGLLAIVTLAHAASLLRPAVEYARANHLPGLAATPQNFETIKLFWVAPLYVILSVFILMRSYRTFVIIGAVVSLLYLGFGTIVGLIFLLWTRKEWPKEGPPTANSLPSGST